ncbi:amino acid transporter [Paeniglutamicibacter sp. ABSL32-1]|uniref:amino acid permease n=1 Tax=Paeniglutamicibacter quisquiliarum TaxID=2849498 RepID=UPI001C2DB2A4|nr:amino acid permease [Paeniglutamicibacter quisquiliarum]MBV1778886.1 amino acid transporter [Paeniglutamicibacter quisquiliarum]
MCLSGLDYFSTLGYQPAIAALAAGALAPLATLLLVAVTLGAALPVYRRVASESPHGQGSIAMLERLLPHWKGKVFVLVLLGFAATDFMITITLSSADATAHIIENPFTPDAFHGQQVIITLVLILLLGALFLRGFHEVIWLAVGLVAAYLFLNLVVIAVAVASLVHDPAPVDHWWLNLTATHSNPWMMVAIALLVFPKLALGLSGFETGVAVMPQIRKAPGDTEANPRARIAGAKKLLLTAALTMSVFLVSSSIVTTLLIPAPEFQPGGEANGRALSFLAHSMLGDGFGSVYDLSTILILWFAGASALAGMLNLIPRYLPRFGMAPEWARAIRPLVLVLIGIAVVITLLFEASVDAQGAAYATGVLVLMVSAAVAVTISAKRKGQRWRAMGFGIISAIFIYTTGANVVERPDGIRIAGFFIAGIIIVSMVSRFRRSTELRATSVTLDEEALKIIETSSRDSMVRIIAHEPVRLSAARYRHKLAHAKMASHLPEDAPVVFIEIRVSDFSDFAQDIVVSGTTRHGYKILQAEAPSVPTAIAAICLEIRDRTGVMPHIYFRWTEGNPVHNLLRFLFLGQGEIAPLTREVLREAEPAIGKRPWVHVG